MSELSQKQLEEMVNGKPVKPRAVFYESAVLDVNASREAGARVYTSQLFLKRSNPGVTDWIPERVQQSHIDEYPAEYADFLANRQGTRKATVDIIPGLEMVHLAELRDRGLATIEALAAAPAVPAHLEYARRAAVRIHATLSESDHDEENRIEESITEEGIKARAVPAPDRPEHGDHVGRSVLPPGANISEEQPAERPEANRRLHRDPGMIGADFSISIG